MRPSGIPCPKSCSRPAPSVGCSALCHLHVASQREIIYLAPILLTFPCIDPLPIGRSAREMKPTATVLAVNASADSKKDKVKGIQSSSAAEGFCQAVFGTRRRCSGSGCLHGLTQVVGCGWTTLSVWEFFQVPLSAPSCKPPWHGTGWVLACACFPFGLGGCDFMI